MLAKPPFPAGFLKLLRLFNSKLFERRNILETLASAPHKKVPPHTGLIAD